VIPLKPEIDRPNSFFLASRPAHPKPHLAIMWFDVQCEAKKRTMPDLKSSIVGETFDKVVRKAEFEGISFVDFLNLPDMPEEAPPARSDAAFASHHGHGTPDGWSCQSHAGLAGVRLTLCL